jgi:hypothetical protein
MPWIMFTDSFLSIVADPIARDTLIVRGRIRGDIERVFPKAKVRSIAGRDYAFRTNLPRRVVADAIAARVFDTPETNFKGGTTENDRHDAYYRCWHAMADLQEARGHGYPYHTTATGKARKRPVGGKVGYGPDDGWQNTPWPPAGGEIDARAAIRATDPFDLRSEADLFDEDSERDGPTNR